MVCACVSQGLSCGNERDSHLVLACVRSSQTSHFVQKALAVSRMRCLLLYLHIRLSCKKLIRVVVNNKLTQELRLKAVQTQKTYCCLYVSVVRFTVPIRGRVSKGLSCGTELDSHLVLASVRSSWARISPKYLYFCVEVSRCVYEAVPSPIF